MSTTAFARRARLAGLAIALLLLAVPATRAWEIDDSGVTDRVIDGDTFDVVGVGRIRLADIDAPESYEPGYQEAKDFLVAEVSGKTVFLDIDDKYGTDPYNRWVAVVYVQHNTTHYRNVNKALLEAGHAVVSDYDNEFSPSTWTLYVAAPGGPPPPPPPPPGPGTDPTTDTSGSWMLAFVMGAGAVVAGGLALLYVLATWRRDVRRR